MRADDFGDKLSDLDDILENCRADIESVMNQWEGEEMDTRQKATIRHYLTTVEELKSELETDISDNEVDIQQEEAEDAEDADGEDTLETKEA